MGDEEDLFTNRAPNPAQATFMDFLTSEFLDMAEAIQQLPPSRFRSLAMTNLEQCSMWAKKAAVFTYAVEDES